MKTLLPKGLLQTLQALDADQPAALLIRHAERAPFPPDAPFADVDLTADGRLQALDLACALPWRPAWAAASPLRRCVETAELLRRRANGEGNAGAPAIEPDTRLGGPGPWVMDPEAGAQLFEMLGATGVVRAQLAGARWPFIREPIAGTQLLLTSATERLAAGLGSGVCISHDAVLMPALAVLVGENFCDRWLAPLDGFAVQLVRGALRCTYRGKQTEVPRW